MRPIVLTGVFLIAACAASAKDKPGYQNGVILQMEPASCGSAEKGSKNTAGEAAGSEGQRQNAHESLCQEYVLQTDRLIFRIRPRDDKHPRLLPVGQSAQFR